MILCAQECGEYIAKNEGVAILLQLCNAEKPAVLRFVSVALANMCAVPSIQKILVEVRGYDDALKGDGGRTVLDCYLSSMHDKYWRSCKHEMETTQTGCDTLPERLAS